MPDRAQTKRSKLEQRWADSSDARYSAFKRPSVQKTSKPKLNGQRRKSKNVAA